MMIESIIYALVVCALGYAFIVGSAVAVWLSVRLLSGYYPSFTFFALALITLRLAEIHYGFILAPPLLATLTMVLLLRTSLDRRIAAGASLSSYYVLAAVLHLIAGAGEFSLQTSIPWMVWVFVMGLGASIVVDKLAARYRWSGP